MQQWEYLEVGIGGAWQEGNDNGVEYGVWADSRGQSGTISEMTVEFTSVQEFGTVRTRQINAKTSVRLSGRADLLNQLGSEGWEVIAEFDRAGDRGDSC